MLGITDLMEMFFDFRWNAYRTTVISFFVYFFRFHKNKKPARNPWMIVIAYKADICLKFFGASVIKDLWKESCHKEWICSKFDSTVKLSIILLYKTNIDNYL